MEIEDLGPEEDSFVDGQQNVQFREAETLERVRNFFGSEVSVDPVDPISPLSPSSIAGHQRPEHTMWVSPEEGSS